ncbi:MAG: DNA replication/repair protein RecF [Eubacteriales bacterium]
MRLDHLTLYSFRNYEQAQFDFVPGVNLIVGDNAQGKTNLLESISYLSTGKSFRTRKEKELIRFDDDFAQLEAQVFAFDRDQKIKVNLFQGRRKRQLFLGEIKQKSMAEMAGVMTSVLFCPEDLGVLKGGAAPRRRLMDAGLCQLRPNYQKALTEYNRLYEHKSRILKDHWENPSLLETLPDFNLRMAEIGAILIGYRWRYLEKLSQLTQNFHREFSGGKEELTIEYQTISTITDTDISRENILEKILEHQESHYQAELRCGMCLTGPHKDDFDVNLDGVSLKSYGSQGQTRTAAISLKLSERQMMKDDTGEEPILLLDDVLSELDPNRQDFILNKIQTGQVFITCCEKEKFTKIGKAHEISAGNLMNHYSLLI